MLCAWLGPARRRRRRRAIAPPASEFPVATDARLEQSGETVRLTMALSRPVEVSAWSSRGPTASSSTCLRPISRFSRRRAQERRLRQRLPLRPVHGGPVAHHHRSGPAGRRGQGRSPQAVRGGFGELVIELKRASTRRVPGGLGSPAPRRDPEARGRHPRAASRPARRASPS